MIDESGRDESRSASKRRRQTSSGHEVVAPVADITGDRVTVQLSRQVDLISTLRELTVDVLYSGSLRNACVCVCFISA